MLTTSQRERILCHLRHGWKLPDSLIQELWEAYEALERAQQGRGPQPSRPGAEAAATDSQEQPAGCPEALEFEI